HRPGPPTRPRVGPNQHVRLGRQRFPLDFVPTPVNLRDRDRQRVIRRLHPPPSPLRMRSEPRAGQPGGLVRLHLVDLGFPTHVRRVMLPRTPAQRPEPSPGPPYRVVRRPPNNLRPGRVSPDSPGSPVAPLSGFANPGILGTWRISLTC